MVARSRNIKHGFFTDDELAEIAPLGRLLFIGLWTLADYKGDVEWRARRIKAQILPYDECDVEALAIHLDQSRFIRFYSCGGRTYINITNFGKHQNPHKNERDKGSEIPAYSEEARQAPDLQGIAIKPDKIARATEKTQTAPADSCSLIPDSCSLIPEPRVSSKLDDAQEIVEYLNQVAGSNYQAVESNTKLIVARFAEGRTVAELKAVIDRQNALWPLGDPQRKYLRPATVFNAEKFNQYFGQLGQAIVERQHGSDTRSNSKLSGVDAVSAAISQRAASREQTVPRPGHRRAPDPCGAVVEAPQ